MKYVYMYTCIHVYMYMCICVYVYMYILVCILSHTYIYLYILCVVTYIYIYIYIHTYIHTYIHVYICIHIRCQEYPLMPAMALSASATECVREDNSNCYGCYIYIYIYTHISMYIYIYIYILCIEIYIYIYKDIATTLRLRQPFVSRLPLDRTNLTIECRQRSTYIMYIHMYIYVQVLYLSIPSIECRQRSGPWFFHHYIN